MSFFLRFSFLAALLLFLTSISCESTTNNYYNSPADSGSNNSSSSSNNSSSSSNNSSSSSNNVHTNDISMTWAEFSTKTGININTTNPQVKSFLEKYAQLAKVNTKETTETGKPAKWDVVSSELYSRNNCLDSFDFCKLFFNSFYGIEINRNEYQNTIQHPRPAVTALEIDEYKIVVPILSDFLKATNLAKTVLTTYLGDIEGYLKKIAEGKQLDVGDETSILAISSDIQQQVQIILLATTKAENDATSQTSSYATISIIRLGNIRTFLKSLQ